MGIIIKKSETMAFIKHTVIHTTDNFKTVYTEEGQTYRRYRLFSDGDFYKCTVKKCKKIIVISGTECYEHSRFEHCHPIDENKKIREAKNKASEIRAVNKFLEENPSPKEGRLIKGDLLKKFVEESVGEKLTKYDRIRLTAMRRSIKGGNKHRTAGLIYTIERVNIIPREKIITISSEGHISKRELLKQNICTA